MDYKPLPIGIEDFEKMRKNDYYYVDKTLFFKELIDKRGEVNLFMRPRRFGKSLTISMVQHFFEIEREGAQLFKGLKIMDAGERYISQMNRYPVIKLTLKTAGKLTFQSAYKKVKAELVREFKRHRYLLNSNALEEEDRVLYKAIISGTADQEDYSGSLKFLSECLEHHYAEKVIVLIDEYDVPLEKSYFNGYYKEMLDFIRSLFDEVLKTNSSLHFALLTGCLRVSKESIFTGLNNLDEVSIISNHYEEYFGFTEREVIAILAYYQLETKVEAVKDWYNGYVFGRARVYNPWSILKCIKDYCENSNWLPLAYWSNTSSNDIVRRLIEVSDDGIKEELEALLHGGSITVPIHEDIVYGDIMQTTVNAAHRNNLWNFLFFTGYLKKSGKKRIGRQDYYKLEIPNEEVLYIYENQIKVWFQEKVRIADTAPFLKAIIGGDADAVESELNKRLKATISFHDSAENFYHGFMTGILSSIDGYIVKSNRESGTGRSDIFLKTTGLPKKAIILELKAMKDTDDPEKKCGEALRQIEEKEYACELEEEHYNVIQKYGIAFYKKSCMVKC